MKLYSVYKHILPKNISGKTNDMVYIGITSQKPERRWNNGHGYVENSYFYRAINKYGWDNFQHDIVYSGLSLEEASKKEIELISIYQSTNRSKGYNLQTGGVDGYHVSEDTIRKLRLVQGGENNGMYGKNHSEETKKRISEHHKQHWMTHIHPMQGKHMSDESKKKISESQKKRFKDKPKNHDRCQKIICTDTNEVYDSVYDLSQKTGIKITTLYSHLNKKYKSCFGHQYRYAIEMNREVV